MAQEDLPPLPLRDGLTEDYIDCTSSCGLNFHIIQAGRRGAPLVLFCHGYPELAYSWRKILPAIASQEYYCVAMDQRGYGRTTGWPKASFHDVDLGEYTMTNLVRDLVCLTWKLGYKQVACIVGHDFGAVASAMAALIRPDVFLSSVQMSHPHHAPPSPPVGLTEEQEAHGKGKSTDIQADLARLQPPRKHYKFDNSTPEAAVAWDAPEQGLEEFLRGYFHLKSADWKGNDPHPLDSWTAEGLAVLPEYYVMKKEHTMPQAIAANMIGEDATVTEAWLSSDELRTYCQEWKRTGFQGALNWYRAQTASTPQSKKDMFLFAGRKIQVPCVFISGKQDWGNHQQPGAFDTYEDDQVIEKGCSRGVRLIDHAGHWVQQEQPGKVIEELTSFLKTL